MIESVWVAKWFIDDRQFKSFRLFLEVQLKAVVIPRKLQNHQQILVQQISLLTIIVCDSVHIICEFVLNGSCCCKITFVQTLSRVCFWVDELERAELSELSHCKDACIRNQCQLVINALYIILNELVSHQLDTVIPFNLIFKLFCTRTVRLMTQRRKRSSCKTFFTVGSENETKKTYQKHQNYGSD